MPRTEVNRVHPEVVLGLCCNAHASENWGSTRQPKGENNLCLLTNEWLNKIQYIKTMEYYLAIKGKKILTCHNTDEP